ncbi:right-handed parallel beta-helix repeat-containing protein [Clostridium sp.]|uniref:right-handed parallel beta-helix repeat-containing protein n=1 Tax=Clostridium sp. TaxID=1506 RepID=UPI003F2E8EE3
MNVLMKKMVAATTALFLITTFTPVKATENNQVENIYISKDGSDNNEGSLDKPFATLERAQQEVREKLSDGFDGKITVNVREGNYFLDKPFVLDPTDSGVSKDNPITYKSYENEKVEFSGAKVLEANNWEVYKDDILKTNVGSGLGIDELFVNRDKQIMARYPNYQEDVTLNGMASARDIKARSTNWSNPINGYIRALHDKKWGGNSYIITGKNPNNALGVDYRWVGDNNRGDGMHTESIMVENILEELDAPNEWFYDNETGDLYFFPEVGVDVNNSVFEGAVNTELIKFVGEKDGEKIKNIVFDGFDYFGTKRTMFTVDEDKSKEYVPLMRGDWCVVRAGAVYIQDAENISITNSNFIDFGGNGVFISGYNSGHLIDNNEFINAGASSIQVVGLPESTREPSFWEHKYYPELTVHKTTIDDKTVGPKAEYYPKDITISRNHMENIGIYEKQSCGVNISVSSRISVVNNTIHKSARSGINVNDGTFGGHSIAYNDIYDCQRETEDHGQFNSWGRDRYWSLGGFNTSGGNGAAKREFAEIDAYQTTKIYNNRMHHSSDIHSFGIDLDDGSTNYEIYDNLLLGIGIKLREGFNRKVYNNIIVGGPNQKNGVLDIHVPHENSRDLVEKNIVIRTNPYSIIPNDQQTMSRADNTIDKNWFYDLEAKITTPGYWKNNKYDLNSIMGDMDPMFKDPANNDYTVTNEAGMEQIGFVNFDMNNFGKPGAECKSPNYEKVQADNGEALDKVKRESWLGATTTAIYDDAILSATGTSDYNGVYFENVPEDSIAYKLGFRTLDIIKSVNGIKLGTKPTFYTEYSKIQQEEIVSLGVVRAQKNHTISYAKPIEGNRIINANKTTTRFFENSNWESYSEANYTTNCIEEDLMFSKGAPKDTTYFEFDFALENHGEIEYINRVANNQGKVLVSIIDKATNNEVTSELIDCYRNVQSLDGQVVYKSPVLPKGEYTLKAINKEEDISKPYFIVDGFKITEYDFSESSIGVVMGATTFGGVEVLAPSKVIDINIPIENISEKDVNLKAILLMHKDGEAIEIEDVIIEDIFVEKGKKNDLTSKYTLPADVDNKVFKVMFVENLDNMKPLTDSFELRGNTTLNIINNNVKNSEDLTVLYDSKTKILTINSKSFKPKTQTSVLINLSEEDIKKENILGVGQKEVSKNGDIQFSFKLPDSFSGDIDITLSNEAGKEAIKSTITINSEESIVNKKALRDKIEEALSKNENDYTFRSWQNLSMVLIEAQDIMKDSNSSQAQVDDVVDRLTTAINELVLVYQKTTVLGNDSTRIKIYTDNNKTPDGGNRDGGNGLWQIRPNSKSVDAYHNGANVEFEFEGNEFEWYGVTANDHGLAQVIITDGNGNVEVDEIINCYSPTRVVDTVLYSNKNLKSGKHKVEITVLGVNGNDQSTEAHRTYVEIYSFRVNEYNSKANLKDIIDFADELTKNSIEGIEIGQYHIGAIDNLKKSVENADLIYNKEDASYEEITNAIDEIKRGIETFNKLLITSKTGDINNNGVIDISDLAIVSKYQGSVDINIPLSVKSDINLDGKVSIYEVEFITNRILGL